MDGLVGDGFIISGGPVGDGEQTLHVVEPRAKTKYVHVLPQIPGRGRIGTIEPRALWLDSRPENSARRSAPCD